MADLFIFGATDAARLAKIYFDTDSDHRVRAFVVDDDYCDSDNFEGLPLIPSSKLEKYYKPQKYDAFVAMGYSKMNAIRKNKYLDMKKLGYSLVSYVSSKCTYLSANPVGDNCFILEDNTIQPFVKIGNNVTLWSGNHIGHDSSIADHCFLASHIVVSGHCHIGESCFIGVNATLRNGLNIAPRTLIAAGALIMEDTVEEGVYLAERAKKISKRSSEIKL